MASKVPKCSATSKASNAILKLSELVHPNSHGIIAKWAELDIGNSSVTPCIIPKINACIIFIFLPLFRLYDFLSFYAKLIFHFF